MNADVDQAQSNIRITILIAHDKITKTDGWYFCIGIISLYFFAACAIGFAYVCVPTDFYFYHNVPNNSTIREEEEEDLEQREKKKRKLETKIIIRTVVPDKPSSKHITSKSSPLSSFTTSSSVLSSMTHSAQKNPISKKDDNIIDLESTELITSEYGYYQSIPSNHTQYSQEQNNNIDSGYKDEMSTSPTRSSFNTRKSLFSSSHDSVQIGTLRSSHASSVCGICLDDYRVGEYIAHSHNEDCIHCYHKDCILEWLVRTKYKSCPICRREFLLSEEV